MHYGMSDRISEARRRAGYRTAHDFSDALHVSVWTVRSWESGKSQPRYDMLERISELTGRSRAWFLGDDELDTSDRAPLDRTGHALRERDRLSQSASSRTEVGGVQRPAGRGDVAPDNTQASALAAEVGRIRAERDRLADELAALKAREQSAGERLQEALQETVSSMKMVRELEDGLARVEAERDELQKRLSEANPPSSWWQRMKGR